MIYYIMIYYDFIMIYYEVRVRIEQLWVLVVFPCETKR